MGSWGFDLASGLTALQQVGDRFSALKDELEQSIEETIRADRFGAPSSAAGELSSGSRLGTPHGRSE